MTLQKIKVLLSAVGCPGGVTMINALKENGEREIEIVGTDMNPEAAGRFFVDKFAVVPAGRSPEFIDMMMEIIFREKPDILLPQSSYEVLPLAQHKNEIESMGTKVIVGKVNAVKNASDKWLTYQSLEGSEVPRPKSFFCDSLEAFIGAADNLGYPDQKICFKPLDSKGTRGFRIISSSLDQLQLQGRLDIPQSTYNETIDILQKAEPFPALLVMEYIDSEEYTVDIFCHSGESLMGFVKTRQAIRGGLGMYFKVVDRPDLWILGKHISNILELDYFANIQFKGKHLLEVNPRVSTFIHQPDFNMPYLAIKYVLGEIDKDELRSASSKLRTTRQSVRYYDQVFFDKS